MNEPLIAQGQASTWPAVQLWTLEYLDERLTNPLKFRLARRSYKAIQWEPDCHYVNASIGQFKEWLCGRTSETCPFNNYALNDWWAYADYVYMNQRLDLESLAKDLFWNENFPALQKSNRSTFWLGSSGSFSLCHYDTYGINLYVQVVGHKRWVLFPPSDSQFLYPTRLPLEESTVFSEVNFPIPDFEKYPLLLKTSPHVVTLKTGDMLFIPRGWWHFVQTVDGDTPYSCSVNMWIDEPWLDNAVRIREAITQLVAFSGLKQSNVLDAYELLHQNEFAVFNTPNWHENLVQYINELATSKFSEKPVIKPQCFDSKWRQLTQQNIQEIFCSTSNVPSSLSTNDQPQSTFKPVINDETILKAFLQPDVIDLVAKYLTGDH